MSDEVLTFCFIGILAEIVILSFLVFRRARGSCLVQLATGLFGLFTSLMMLLVIVSNAEQPTAFTDQSRLAFPAAFVVLAVMIVGVGRSGMRNPIVAPRKRPVIVDIIGCAVVGAVALVLLVAAIAFLAMLGR